MSSDTIVLLPSKSHIADKVGAVITFNATQNTLVSSNTGAIAFTDFVDGDIVAVTGSASNNSTFTVSGSPTATTLTVLETVATEAVVIGLHRSRNYAVLCKDNNTKTNMWVETNFTIVDTIAIELTITLPTAAA